MGLLAPWFLGGILAVGLPIWLHFLRRHESNPLPFSSLMFFEQREQSSVQPKRLRYLLLLALRVALILLLALAFANPFVRRTTASTAATRLLAIVIDRSFSMRSTDHLQQAKTKALQLVSRKPANQQAEVLALDSRIEKASELTKDPETLRQAIESIQPADGASSYVEMVRFLRALERDNGQDFELHLISDMQATSLPGSFADLQLGDRLSLVTERIGEGAAPNWAVDNVDTAYHLYGAGNSKVVASLRGFQTPEKVLTAQLILDQNVLESKQVPVPASGRGLVEFSALNVPHGVHRGEVRIASQDRLPEDDAYLFPVDRSDPQRVLFAGKNRMRESFYFKAALEADENSGFTVATAPVGELGQQDFQKYAFVVLSDAGKIAATEELRLTEYVRSGGGLLILAGPETARERQVPVTHETLDLRVTTQGVTSADQTHPVIGDLGALPNVQFFSTAAIPASSARVLLRLADGTPLLTERALGEGRVLLFGSTFDNLSNDFPVHRSFLPFVLHAARYLTNANLSEPNVLVGAPVELRRSGQSNVAVDIAGPDGKPVLSRREATAARSLQPDRAGFYEVRKSGGQNMLLAAHVDPRESDLTPLTDETLALWRGSGSGNSRMGEQATQHTEDFALWRYLLIAGLGIALAESIWGSKYLKTEGKTHDGDRTAKRVFAKT